MNAERFRNLLGWVIVAAWVCSLAFDFIPDGYAVSINGSMMLVAGYVFGPAIVGRARKDEQEWSGWREFVVGLSYFGAGFAVYLAVGINLRDAVHDRDPWPLAWMANRLSLAIIVLLAGEHLSQSAEVSLTWRIGLYLFALLGACISWVFIGIDHRRRNRRKTDREGNQDG